MSGPFGSSQWMYKAGDFYEFPIEQSLKFNDNDTAYLSKSFATTGTDRKKFTFSCWYKKSTVGTVNQLFNNFNGSNEYAQITIDSSDRLEVYSRPSSGVTHTYRVPSSRLRDPSAWYHIVVEIDTTQATASDRVKIYINGVLQTDFDTNTLPSQNTEMNFFVAGRAINIGRRADGGDSSQNLDGYLAEVNCIDGLAYDPTSFGEFKSGVWIPKDPSNLTYGTNGFRLSFQNDTVSEGFNTALYRGNGADTHSISGLGFAPDLVWVKSRSAVADHHLYDSVRGANLELRSNTTNSERLLNGTCGFHSDGFTVGTATTNTSGGSYVAWCWDAGSGSPVSNTDGSITSTVKANAAYGMSIISYTATGTAGTIGHGLNSTPEMIIVKHRDQALTTWPTYHSSIGATNYLRLNATNASATDANAWNNTAPTASVFSVGNNGGDTSNTLGGATIAYAFHSVAGYSKVGSYSGSGSTGNAITTGFKPAFVMIKRSDNVGSWVIWDNTRDTTNPNQYPLYPNLTNTESFEPTDRNIQFDSNGFTLLDGNNDHNASGGTYIYIAFADTRDNAFWLDQSGNGNDWQPNNLTYQDGFPDAPTNNFATLNPNHAYDGGADYSEGNLRFVGDGSSFRNSQATIGVSSGKWYWELIPELNASANTSFGIGEDTANWNDTGGLYNNTGFWLGNFDTGTNFYYYANGSSILPDSLTFNQNDVVGLAFDADNGTFKLYANNTLMRTFTGIPAGTYLPFVEAQGTAYPFINVNFGQDSSFAGIKPAQGNTDENGYGDFYYAPPSGYLALCTANLPDPVIDPAKDDVPSDYFNTVLYTGNGGTQSVTVGWQPDLIWGKSRNNTFSHALHDAVRGFGNRLVSNDTAAESFRTDAFQSTAVDSTGFNLGSQGDLNYSGNTMVAWNWLAGNGTSSNTSGSISSTVSVNQKAGFSVVSYTGTGAAATVGHGLGAKPAMLIVKKRTSAAPGGNRGWAVWHQSLATDKVLELNTTNAQLTEANFFIEGNINSTTFGVGADYNTGWTDDYIAYCFAEVEGYSKFGSYTGNGSTDGPFVYTGFRPAWVLYKNADGAGNSWLIFDEARTPYNQEFLELKPDSAAAESPAGSYAYFDFLSNGFKPRTTSTALNASGQKIIYMAFAESPFKYSNAR